MLIGGLDRKDLEITLFLSVIQIDKVRQRESERDRRKEKERLLHCDRKGKENRRER
jgi:hypothetical protein